MQSTSTQSELILLISKLNSQLIKNVEGQLSFHGISFTEYLVLRSLHESPKNTMRRIDLAESIGLSASGVTRLIAPMEKIKLVEKETNPRDVRVSLVKLSKTGAQIYQEASVSFDHSAAFINERLSDKQLVNLVELVDKLI